LHTLEWKNTYERSSLSLDEESGTGLGGFTLRLKIKIKAISLRKEVLTVHSILRNKKSHTVFSKHSLHVLVNHTTFSSKC